MSKLILALLDFIFPTSNFAMLSKPGHAGKVDLTRLQWRVARAYSRSRRRKIT